jgi:hypothetical protein
MLYTIADLNEVFYEKQICSSKCRSSNPFDYIRNGYFLDNGALFGGYNNVSYKNNISSNFTSNLLDITNK